MKAIGYVIEKDGKFIQSYGCCSRNLFGSLQNAAFFSSKKRAIAYGKMMYALHDIVPKKPTVRTANIRVEGV